MFVLSSGTIKAIKNKIRKFLWSGATNRFVARVSWRQVCKSSKAGGLGIPDIAAQNKALMCKHLWDVLTKNKDSVWLHGFENTNCKRHRYEQYRRSEALRRGRKCLNLDHNYN
ncbi:UNVERIFIED_CONTAM: hypothetical protein Sradi_5873700 [Sesamum radiatum]|uniref:Uncharacterized protein n=1 Tax=Sesamum radiatum TaxID=300843 RepID=A0AAW2KQP3_SESRA